MSASPAPCGIADGSILPCSCRDNHAITTMNDREKCADMLKETPGAARGHVAVPAAVERLPVTAVTARSSPERKSAGSFQLAPPVRPRLSRDVSASPRRARIRARPGRLHSARSPSRRHLRVVPKAEPVRDRLSPPSRGARLLGPGELFGQASDALVVSRSVRLRGRACAENAVLPDSPRKVAQAELAWPGAPAGGASPGHYSSVGRAAGPPSTPRSTTRPTSRGALLHDDP